MLRDLRANPSNLPVIGWRNVIGSASVSASSFTTGFPASAAKTYQSHEGWKPSGESGRISFTFSSTKVDYVGVTLINGEGSQVQLFTLTGSTWKRQSFSVTVSGPVLWVFEPIASCKGVRIDISGPGYIANVMAGERIELQRKIYVGHTPIRYGRDTSKVQGWSDRGQYLGVIKRRTTTATSVSLDNITPDHFRNVIDPFMQASEDQPHYWSWRSWIPGVDIMTSEGDDIITTESDEGLMPTDASPMSEVGYAWLDNDGSASNVRSNGMMQVSWGLQGISGRL